MLELCGVMWCQTLMFPGQEVDAACIIVGDRKSTNLQLGVEETTCGTLQSHNIALARLCLHIHI